MRRDRKAAPQTGAFFEYPGPDGKAWRCDLPDKLFVDFGIMGDAATRLDDLDDDQIAKLLWKHGFEDVPPNYQRYMARRIVEF